MIRIIRERSKTAVPTTFRPPGNKTKELTLLKAKRDHLVRLKTDAKASHGFSSSWWNKAKDQLIVESCGKCAYCEASATAVSYGDVEHFRPKAVWWWLTCCWENYVFSCQICNQGRFKGDNFPLRGNPAAAPVKVTATTADSTLAKMIGKLGPDPLDMAAAAAHWKKLFTTEKPDLIDPANENPEALLAYVADDNQGTVTVVPRSKNAIIKRRVAACIKYYGLNREELRDLRYDTYESIADAREALAEPNLSTKRRSRVLKRLERFVSKKRQFAGMSRYYLIDKWQLLPASLRA